MNPRWVAIQVYFAWCMVTVMAPAPACYLALLFALVTAWGARKE